MLGAKKKSLLAKVAQRPRPVRELDEGDYSRRRLGDQHASGDAGSFKTAATCLRQTDDLLPTFGVTAGRCSRNSRNLNAGGHAAFRAIAGKRRTVGHYASV